MDTRTGKPAFVHGAVMKDDAGNAFGEMLNKLGRVHDFRARRTEAILDAYIRSGETGRSYQEERDALLAERGLGTIED